MQTKEEKVRKNSEYFVWTPSALAQETFFYPLVIGHHFYEKEYFIHRESFDSFLIMYMVSGECTVYAGDSIYRAGKGQTVILDCYRPHAYTSETGWETLWVHFDGPMSRKYFEMITDKNCTVLNHRDSARFEEIFQRLYKPFHDGGLIREAVMSEQITELLTELIMSREMDTEKTYYSEAVAKSMAYIREHICDETLSLELLSQQINLSRYYYVRLFKRETGYTPHEYIILSRINAAKYLLKSNHIPVKEICYRCGFHSESAFCNTFRKWEGMTPMQFRKNTD